MYALKIVSRDNILRSKSTFLLLFLLLLLICVFLGYLLPKSCCFGCSLLVLVLFVAQV